MSTFHKPVLVSKVITYLNVINDKYYIDATLGGGGHSLAILKKGGIVLGIDRDREALNYARERLASYQSRTTLVKGNFSDLYKIAQENNFRKVAGILFDLGVSTHQLKDTKRGFSFNDDAPLDMRMDQEQTKRALEIINHSTFDELYSILLKYGEESLAKPITIAITNQRKKKQINTTKELSEIVISVYQKYRRKTKINPATKTFQALRIAVNDELNALRSGLEQATRLLDIKGRLVVLSFHSLEDRIVKLFYRRSGLRIITKKPEVPDMSEIKLNQSARSAKLRAGEKI